MLPAAGFSVFFFEEADGDGVVEERMHSRNPNKAVVLDFSGLKYLWRFGAKELFAKRAPCLSPFFGRKGILRLLVV
jgi:hypothetical protein